MHKRVLGGFLTAALLFSSIGLARAEFDLKKEAHDRGKVKNVIFLIPDGYSSAYATNYRWFKGSTTTMDKQLVGMMKTDSANSKVTDSAAAGTAMATGHKTNNGMISVNPQGQNLKTILEAAEEQGKSSGLVATSTITHATPAVFASHVASRGSEADIAPQLLEKVDVLLGGGKQFFLPQNLGGKQPSRNLVEEAQNKGYKFVENGQQLAAVKGTKLLGLFSSSGMAPELDREDTNQPSLAEMTKKALESLSQDKDGFFLMVEGSQIDWAGHVHDAAWAMSDAAAFEDAVEEAINFANKNDQTLIVIAGDHDTGGMSVNDNGPANSNLEALRKITATGDYMTGKFNADGSNIREIVQTYSSIALKDAEISQIKVSTKPASVLNDLISQKVLVGWTTGGHTGTDVPLYAYGPGSELFAGLHDNTEIPKLMAQAMKIKF